MIRLEIGQQLVALNPAISLDFYEYNAIFDVEQNRGTFTYDFDIDLRDGDNAKLYQHLNRINSKPVFTGRAARLFVGGRVQLEGTEIILECSGNLVKIQIVGGNSEVNAIGKSLRLNQLDLGSLPEYTSAEALATIEATPLSVPAVCTPVMVEYQNFPFVTQNVERETTGKMVNLAEYTDLWNGGPKSFHPGTKFIGQPYLVVVVERVLQALGWDVTYNVLRELEYAKRLIIIHGYETSSISLMLPNWTVNDFLEQIQRMFNVIIILDVAQHSVKILHRETFYYQQANTVAIRPEDIIKDDESPGRTYEDSESYVYGYEFVKYDFPSRTYGYRGDLSDDLQNIVAIKHFNSYSEFNGAASSYRNADFYNKAVFLYDDSTRSKWMLAKGGIGGFAYRFVRVDQFAHVKSSSYKEGVSSETILKIVPAESMVMAIYMTDPSMVCGVVVPFAQQSGIVGADFTTSSEYGLNQWVEGGAPKARDTAQDKLYVAQFLGKTSVLAESHDPSSSTYERYATACYPQIFTHRYIDARLYGNYMENWKGNWRDYILDALWDKYDIWQDITFDLGTRLTTTYANSLKIDDKEVHTIYIKVKDRMDITPIFNIAGRRFVCISMQYQARNGAMLPYAIGRFLPLK